MGTDSVNINWINDLPPFQSKFGPGPDIGISVQSFSLKRISRPPSYYSVLNWCQEKSLGVNEVVESDKINEDDEDDLGNYRIKIETIDCMFRKGALLDISCTSD